MRAGDVMRHISLWVPGDPVKRTVLGGAHAAEPQHGSGPGGSHAARQRVRCAFITYATLSPSVCCLRIQSKPCYKTGRSSPCRKRCHGTQPLEASLRRRLTSPSGRLTLAARTNRRLTCHMLCRGLAAVDFLMPSYYVWAKIIEALADLGYDPNMLVRHGSPRPSACQALHCTQTRQQ